MVLLQFSVLRWSVVAEAGEVPKPATSSIITPASSLSSKAVTALARAGIEKQLKPV